MNDPSDSSIAEQPPNAPRIDHYFTLSHVPAHRMDELWSAGWRHQGIVFYRYSETDIDDEHHHIIPLRIDVTRSTPSKSQRRVLRSNADLRSEFLPAAFDDQIHAMFARHCERFDHNVPEAITSFFSDNPSRVPCTCLAQRVTLHGQLIAVSFIDIGQRAGSSVYAIFEPEHSHRSLGTYTMLKEIEYAQQHHLHWLYHGYATQQPSHYDYKRTFSAVEGLDWQTGHWTPLDKASSLPASKTASQPT